MSATVSLDDIRIASPCKAAWDRMEGDDRARFCVECGKHVYDLSAMSRKEAERLVFETEGRPCVRFYRRRDGTVLTDNCPVGLRRARRWLLTQTGGIALAFTAVIAGPAAGSQAFRRLRHSRLAKVEPFHSFFEWVDPTPAPPPLALPGMLMPISRPAPTTRSSSRS